MFRGRRREEGGGRRGVVTSPRSTRLWRTITQESQENRKRIARESVRNLKAESGGDIERLVGGDDAV